MSDSIYVLFLDTERVRLAKASGDHIGFQEIEGSAADEPCEVASRSIKALRSSGYRGESVLLALPSSWCLVASIVIHDLPPRGGREAKLYRLEEKLPVEAERVVADFIAHHGSALGVAVASDRIQPIIEELEAQGVLIESVVPTALLAVQGLHEDSAVVLSCDGPWVDLLQVHDGVPVLWRLLDQSAKGVALELERLPEPPDAVLAQDIDGELRDDVQKRLALPGDGSGLSLDSGCDPRHVAAAKAARSCLVEAVAPWIELRRDSLASGERHRRIRSSVRAAVVAFLLCLLSLSVALQIRAQRYRTCSEDYRSETVAVFSETFPGQTPPVSVLRRMESRLRELRGVQGLEEEPERWASSALDTLALTLDRMPDDVRLCLLEVRIDDRTVFISGKTQSHGDAERVAAALRSDGEFEVDAPRSENLKDRGVAFTLGASLSSSARYQGGSP